MKIKTADLIGPALDWMVAVAEGATRIQLYEYSGRRMIRVSLPEGIHAPWEPSRYWGQGGPIIEREWIELGAYHDQWLAVFHGEDGSTDQYGPTPLIAAMRCFVASRLNDEVDIPGELL